MLASMHALGKMGKTTFVLFLALFPLCLSRWWWWWWGLIISWWRVSSYRISSITNFILHSSRRSRWVRWSGCKFYERPNPPRIAQPQHRVDWVWRAVEEHLEDWNCKFAVPWLSISPLWTMIPWLVVRRLSVWNVWSGWVVVWSIARFSLSTKTESIRVSIEFLNN